MHSNRFFRFWFFLFHAVYVYTLLCLLLPLPGLDQTQISLSLLGHRLFTTSMLRSTLKFWGRGTPIKVVRKQTSDYFMAENQTWRFEMHFRERKALDLKVLPSNWMPLFLMIISWLSFYNKKYDDCWHNQVLLRIKYLFLQFSTNFNHIFAIFWCFFKYLSWINKLKISNYD